MIRLWSWLRARLRREERVVVVGEIAWLMQGDAWRAVGPAERPDLFEHEVCRSCGCTELRACVGGCSWVTRGLCSRCWPLYGGTD